MPEPRELELKYHFEGREDYLRMIERCAAAAPPGQEAQDNYYFDTPSYDLARSQGMLRLRSKGIVILGFKKGREQAGSPGYFDVIEVECEISEELFKEALRAPSILYGQALEPMRVLKKHYGELELGLIGQLNTIRRRRALGGYLLEQDEVTYADGGKSYEVEIETEDPEGARRALMDQLESLSVKAAPQHLSKLQGMLVRAGSELPGLPRAP